MQNLFTKIIFEKSTFYFKKYPTASCLFIFIFSTRDVFITTIAKLCQSQLILVFTFEKDVSTFATIQWLFENAQQCVGTESSLKATH